MPRVIIDGRESHVPAGTTVIRAAESMGIFIPRYCYHPALSIAGNCRICLVEVENFPKLQIACNTPVSDGMVVHTRSAKAEEGRRNVLEFLLANHPLDCPVCDQSGECDLQNYYMDFGLYNPRFREHKVKKKKAVQLGPHVMLDQERCILCSRCVRFTDEITGTGEFGIFNRGDRAELGLYPGVVLDNPYSANVVDICPVGALTEKDFRFKARVWYLSRAPSVCNACSRGCNIDVHYLLDRPHLNEGARIVRIKPRYNPYVNQWWICDEGRYSFGWVDRDRLLDLHGPTPDASWEEALSRIGEALKGGRAGVIASLQLTNEELFLIREIFGGELGARITTSVPEKPGKQDDFLIRADKTPNRQGASLLGLAPGENPSGEVLLREALEGKLAVLWVFGHDLLELYGEEVVRAVSEKVPLFVYSGTNRNRTVPFAHWGLPAAAYLEKDGTFVNCDGRVQRVGRVLPPPGNSREDWRFLLELGRYLGLSLPWRNPEEIFRAMAEKVEAFQGLDYQKLGLLGVEVPRSPQRES